MSKTMANPNDWAHFYHNHNHNQLMNFSSSSAAGGGSSSGVTAVTTASTITSSAAAAEPTPIQLMGSGRGGGGGGHNPVANSTLSPEGGRVAKPARRRSRASRRTPTTLLNTDTSNFRAMVQQFTGGPAGPFVTGGSSLNVPQAGFSFGLGIPTVGLGQHHHQLINDRIPNPAANLPVAATGGGGGGGGGGGDGLFHHLPYQPSQFHQPSPFLFSLGNAGNSDDPTNIDGINSDLLLQRGIGTEGTASVAGTRVGGGGTTAAAPPPAGSNEHRNSGFLY